MGPNDQDQPAPYALGCIRQFGLVYEHKDEGMKIVLRKSDWLEDWYSIERAQHEGRQWLEPTGPNSMKFMDSGRISDACVEGTAEEMRAIAEAIKARHWVTFKRCAVRVEGDRAYFCSPRNSTRDAEVPLADADEFADQALAALAT